MSNPYIAQDVLDQCREALRQGRTLEYLAGQLRCDVGHLSRMLGLPTTKPVATTDDPDLWRTHELDGLI